MSQTLIKIAQKLKTNNKKVQLIYAFNGTGKTRLSREFKQLIAPTSDGDEAELSPRKILYYNAFTEDLFYWDNDLRQDTEPKLKIQPNSFTDWILKDQGQDRNIITNFQRYTNDKLTPLFIDDFTAVSFSLERGDDASSGNLKISKGEESVFIWSVFFTLLEQVISILNVAEPIERETDQFNQLEYIFVDDPVSSLDENHLIELAVQLGALITSSSSTLKFIITTHNPLFYNVLFNELKTKGCYMLLKNEDGTFQLDEKHGDSNKSFSYHLYLKQTIEEAIEGNKIQRYHFMLLRNLYEKTASFLGYPRWSELLPGDKQAYLNRIIQFTSHRTLSNEEVAEPSEPEKQTVKFLLNNLISNYGFWQQGENNG
ncbi:MAG: AAA family ATPase [Leptospiraceae bacterium]|nr:AAA family ATPase [Myxococcales bacterium]MCP5499487.1 AAA family ATPase [Leptospiraceae bacterium]